MVIPLKRNSATGNKSAATCRKESFHCTRPSDRSTQQENGGHAYCCPSRSTTDTAINVGVANGSNVNLGLLDGRFDAIDG